MAKYGLGRLIWAATGLAVLSPALVAQEVPLAPAPPTAECAAEPTIILPTTGMAFTLPPAQGGGASLCQDMPRSPTRPSPPNIFGTVALPVKSTSMRLRWDAARQLDAEAMPGAWRDIARQARTMTGRQKLAFINSWVNNHVAFTEDGDRDHWASAAETSGIGRGDCEDLAIAKLALLRETGTAAEDLFLVIVRDTVRNRDHAVLVARMDGEMMVLDSRTDRLLPSGAITDYRPMFSFEGPFAWTHGYKSGPAPIPGN
jgi:predicted transglutaminase-like cysteine proteinase